MSGTNVSTSNIYELECPEYDDSSFKIFSFWVEGVISCCVAILGFFGNIGSAYILSMKEMRNSFNLLLIALSCFDNFYLLCGVLESFRRHFALETDLHTILFPYFLYPFQMIAMTGSILMTVAIALERYVAVHYPLNYSQSMNDSAALRQRMIKYLIPVMILSVMFNITKFFEARIDYKSTHNEWINFIDEGLMINRTYLISKNEIPIIKATDLRLDPSYSIYYNWFRFFSIGILPFGLLVLFNGKIYGDIQDRRKRAGFRKQANTTICSHGNTRGNGGGGSPVTQGAIMTSTPPQPSSPVVQLSSSNNDDTLKNKESSLRTVLSKKMVEKARLNSQTTVTTMISPPITTTSTRKNLTESEDPTNDDQNDKNFFLNESNDLEGDESSSDDYGESKIIDFKSQRVVSFKNSNRNEGRNFVNRSGSFRAALDSPTNVTSPQIADIKNDCEAKVVNIRPKTTAVLVVTTPITINASPSSVVLTQTPPPPVDYIKANVRRRRMEDHLASIFMGYILVFLICHSPRLMLNIYELAIIRKAEECIRNGQKSFPLWCLIVTCISHLLLILNSSINILIYCLLSSKFREECIKVFQRLIRKINSLQR